MQGPSRDALAIGKDPIHRAGAGRNSIFFQGRGLGDGCGCGCWLACRLIAGRVMTIAVPVWDGRVAPVLDVARRLLVVEFGRGGEPERAELSITAVEPQERVSQIAGRKVSVLICGALSRVLESMLTAAGIEVVPYVCGPVEDVLQAYRDGRLQTEAFLMPGHSRSGRLRRGRGSRGRRGGRGRRTQRNSNSKGR